MRLRLKGEKPQEPLHYKGCGLDDVYLINGYERVTTPYGDGVTIKNLDELHVAIGIYLAKQKKALSGKELRYLRKQMDLTQSELGRIIEMSSQQVARWEKGESEIPGPAEILIRGLYIQHIGGKLDLQALAKELDAKDSAPSDKAYFEPTAQGWKRAACG